VKLNQRQMAKTKANSFCIVIVSFCNKTRSFICQTRDRILDLL
jgi:hypothetical protein